MLASEGCVEMRVRRSRGCCEDERTASECGDEAGGEYMACRERIAGRVGERTLKAL
jgi:hypothetical protein